MKYNVLSLLLAVVGIVMLLTLHNVLAIAINIHGLTKDEASLQPALYSLDNMNRVVLLILGLASMLFAIKGLRVKHTWAFIPLILSVALIIAVFLPLWKFMM